MSQEVMTIAELAVYLDVAESTIYKKVQAREIPFTKLGNLLRFTKPSIDGWLARNTTQPDDDLFNQFALLQNRYHRAAGRAPGAGGAPLAAGSRPGPPAGRGIAHRAGAAARRSGSGIVSRRQGGIVMDSYIDSPWFHLPDEPVADFQRAVGMARGTLIRMGRHGGVVEVDGFRYELVDHRRPPWREQCPLAKFAGRLLGFNFYPTYSPQEAAELEPDEPPRLKLSQLRREVPAPNLVEVIGTVAEAGGGRMLVQLTSHQGARPWVVPLVGRYPGGVGERVQLTARLEAGQLRYLDHRLLAPGAMTIADAMRAAGGPALPASAAR